MLAKKIHRTTAFLLIAFILCHLSVHLTSLAGADAHLAALDSIQWIYRNPVGETILVAAILTQIISGARRLRFRGIDGWARVQVISGAYLIVFLVMHTTAALYTHHIFGLETDFYWSAGSLAYAPLKYGFALYYFAAITAVFAHLAAALHFGWPRAPEVALRALPIGGAVIAVGILSAMMGLFYPIEIGPDVAAYYETYFGVGGPSR